MENAAWLLCIVYTAFARALVESYNVQLFFFYFAFIEVVFH